MQTHKTIFFSCNLCNCGSASLPKPAYFQKKNLLFGLECKCEIQRYYFTFIILFTSVHNNNSNTLKCSNISAVQLNFLFAPSPFSSWKLERDKVGQLHFVENCLADSVFTAFINLTGKSGVASKSRTGFKMSKLWSIIP